MGRTPEGYFTFVGLLPQEEQEFGTVSITVEVLDRLREIEADAHAKAANQAMPLASQARHKGVATGISIALSAIEGDICRIDSVTSARERR